MRIETNGFSPKILYVPHDDGNIGGGDRKDGLGIMRQSFDDLVKKEERRLQIKKFVGIVSSFFPGFLGKHCALEGLKKLMANEAIPELIKFLEYEESNVRSKAVEILGELGAREAIPKIIELVADKSHLVSASAEAALIKLNSKDAIPGLRILLNHNNVSVKNAARNILHKLKKSVI